MPDKNAQIRNKMIQTHPTTDRQKLAGLETFIHRNFAHVIRKVVMEPFVIFTKGEDECYGWYTELTNDIVERFLVHRVDLLLITHDDNDIFFELDGGIHDIKTEKTNSRNTRYELNQMGHIVINEADLKLKLGIPKSRNLSQSDINNEFASLLEKHINSISKEGQN